MTNSLDSSKQCPMCNDSEFLVDGWTAKPCPCAAQKRLYRRMKNAMIPEEFSGAQLDTYIAKTQVQKLMLDATKDYLKEFDEIKSQSNNSLGFIAVYGEQKIRQIKNHVMRAEVKRKHNSFGLGKTHLQVAAAKELIKRGNSVLIVSDVVFMEDLSRARGFADEGEEISRLLGAAIKVDVLVWDDIGKAKVSKFRRDMYYQIINERYRARRPILFSSNEDMETLAEQIGDAAASRLFGMAKGRLYVVEGADYRLQGA
jgi:DNA replication protein DnaC